MSVSWKIWQNESPDKKVMHDDVKSGKTLPHWLGDFLSYLTKVIPNCEPGALAGGAEPFAGGSAGVASR